MTFNLRRAFDRVRRARSLRVLPEHEGAAVYLPYPLRKAAAALSLAMLFGCSSAATKVATHQVARDYYRARFDQACHVPAPPTWCAGFDLKLNRTDADLREAVSALEWVKKSNARMPLQLKALTDDKKALEAGYKP